MPELKPDFEMLNAYIDGELDAEHAADVARAVAVDKKLAHQVAVLSQLRSAVIDSIDTPELALPHRPISSRGNYRPWLVAACLAGLIALASFMLGKPSDQSVAEEWIPAAWALHQAWVLPPQGFDPDQAPDGTSGEVIPASSAGSLAGSYIPDLTSAKLFVAYSTDQYNYRGNRSLLVGYTGTRGCKVTLLVTGESAPLSEQMTYFQRENVSIYGWRVGKLDYMLMAEGMAITRFQSIAEAVYRSTKAHFPVDNKTRVALAESRATSAPCLT